MKKTILGIILLALAASGLSACAGKRAAAEGTAQTEQPKTIIAEGRLQPLTTLDLSFSVAGQVDSLLVQDGQQVRKGQALARLADVPEAHAVLARAKEEAVLAELELADYQAAAARNIAQAELEVILSRNRYKTAYDNYISGKSRERKARMDEADANVKLAEAALERIVANAGLDPQQVDALQARLDAAQAAVRSAQAQVDALELDASMAGRVVDIRVSPGQQIAAGETVMALADYSKWIIKTDSLTELEVVQVQEGQAVEVILDALPDLALAGHVTDINARFEEKRGDITYTVNVELDEADERMRWGMTAAVYFQP